jgi:GNAT superfamily N-acetyltransferase
MIRVEGQPLRSDVSRVFDAVDSFNVAATGDASDKTIVAFLRRDGHVQGGVIGDCWGGWLHIRALWVAEPLRRQGHGSRLLEAVEEAAREAGCSHSHLETFSFQAPEFYQRRGYEVFGCLPGYPPTHTQYFLRKDLSGADDRSEA